MAQQLSAQLLSLTFLSFFKQPGSNLCPLLQPISCAVHMLLHFFLPCTSSSLCKSNRTKIERAKESTKQRSTDLALSVTFCFAKLNGSSWPRAFGTMHSSQSYPPSTSARSQQQEDNQNHQQQEHIDISNIS